MAERVLILGDGAMGTTITRLLSPQHDIFQWAVDLNTWQENAPLEDVAREQDFVIFAVPANPHRQLSQRIAPHLAKHCICLTIAKGLDDAACTPSEVFASSLPKHNAFGVIYGPMIATEIQANKPGFARVGIDPNSYQRVRKLFTGTALRLAHCEDIVGLSWSVILKNVYVPLIAASEALDYGDNARGYLVYRAVAELNRIVIHMGGQPGTAYQEAGLADLVTTATSESSHHRMIGTDLATGRLDRIAADGINIRGEGIHTIAMVTSRGLFDVKQYPLFAAMAGIVAQPDSIAQHLANLLAQPT